MSGITPARIPYPTDGDLVQLVDESIQAVAEAAGGLLGYANRTADQAGITADTNLTGLSVAVTVPANHVIRVTGQLRADSTVAGDVIRCTIRHDGAQVQAFEYRAGAANIGDTMIGQVILVNPASGAHTYNLSLMRVIGTGTITARGSAANPSFITVEDLGPV